MDRSTHVTLGGFLTGLVVGFGTGWLWAIFRSSWKSVTSAKGQLDGAQKSAWERTRDLLILGFLLAVVAALALGGLGQR